MTNTKLKFIFSGFVLLTSSMSVGAESNFEYPELAVVPRASERLEAEAAKEKTAGWKSHLNLLVPATFTAVTGVVMAGGKDPSKAAAAYAPWVGAGVGAAWWLATFAILNPMEMYSDGAAEVSKMPAKSQREQLARERRAEESIRKAGALARKLKWISVGSNLGASAMMLGFSNKASAAFYMSAASALVSLTPLIFPHQWEATDCTHQEYKKRIYAPVLSSMEFNPTVLNDPNGFIFSPGLQLSLRF